MSDLGEQEIDLAGYSVRIIVENRIINNHELKWRNEENGGIVLTLDEIAAQINTPDVIYVWIELGLSGEIYLYNNHADGKWHKHGTTQGYA